MYVIFPHVKIVVHVSVHAFDKMNTLYMNYSVVYYAPREKGGILFCNCRSVGQSVDQVLSAQYLLTPSLDQYQTWCRGYPQ